MSASYLACMPHPLHQIDLRTHPACPPGEAGGQNQGEEGQTGTVSRRQGGWAAGGPPDPQSEGGGYPIAPRVEGSGGLIAPQGEGAERK